jgi:glyoxylase-like metal-dependent hydrolase (beta-lactamase superfamily II)
MSYKKIKPGIYLVDLDLKIGGFTKFISSWIYHRHGLTIVVDPGPSSTLKILLEALKKLDISSVDFLLLTHIHVDHAGGSGDLLKKFPGTKVICHPNAAEHLINPQKLWRATLKVLGKSAEQYYGEIKPLPKHTEFFHENIDSGDVNIKIVETPGHAAHHLCIQIDELLFAGEALGVWLTQVPEQYHRPATPPIFKYEIFSQSVKNITRLQGVKKVCFGHYGTLDMPLKKICDNTMRQMDLWLKIVSDNLNKSTQNIRAEILKRDKSLQPLNDFPEDIYERELSFFLNSISGMRQYLQSTT